MPLFEYSCLSCGRHVELLVGVGSGNGSVECPHCGGKRMKKLFSKFGVRSKGSDGATTSVGSACGGCTASDCSTCS